MMLSARRWTRYGHDRVYVTHEDGTKIGYLDLKTGESHINDPDLTDAFNAAVEPFRQPSPSHLDQAPPDSPTPDPTASAGLSLQHEYDRRMQKREDRVTERFPRVGRLLLAVFDEAPSTRAFKKGAEGERRAVKRILADGGYRTLILVNRRLGHNRRDGDIDVIAITPAGVHVIDVKYYEEARISVERTGGLFSPRVEHLRVRGRDSTHLVDKLDKQVEAVRTSVTGAGPFGDVPIQPALCFVDAFLPMFEALSIRGVSVLGPKRTAKWLREATGPYGESEREDIFEILDRQLPPAPGE